MLSRIFAVLVVAVVFVSRPAAALVYVSVLGGGNLLEDTGVRDGGTLQNSNSMLQTSMGYNVAGAVGVNIGSLRFEGEIGYAANEIDRFTNVVGGNVGTGAVSTLSYMGNVYWDVPVPLPLLTPYVGAGAGYATVSFDGVAFPSALVADSRDEVFAWQVGGGVAIKFAPLTRMVLDYRYFATEDPSLTDSFGNRFSIDYARHTYRIGLRIGF